MAYQKLGKHEQARQAFNSAIQWLEEHEKSLTKPLHDSLASFRLEAEQTGLGLANRP
jgi:hypothetical protein